MYACYCSIPLNEECACVLCTNDHSDNVHIYTIKLKAATGMKKTSIHTEINISRKSMFINDLVLQCTFLCSESFKIKI